jgi:hypothetical protein
MADVLVADMGGPLKTYKVRRRDKCSLDGTYSNMEELGTEIWIVMFLHGSTSHDQTLRP